MVNIIPDRIPGVKPSPLRAVRNSRKNLLGIQRDLRTERARLGMIGRPDMELKQDIIEAEKAVESARIRLVRIERELRGSA